MGINRENEDGCFIQEGEDSYCLRIEEENAVHCSLYSLTAFLLGFL